MICVYKITSPSNKIYIGSTNNFKRRMQEYKYLACKDQIRLYNSIVKYKWENHKCEIIETLELNDLYTRERYWQEYYNVIGKNGLNCQYVDTKNKKREISQDTKNKISKAMSGINNPSYGVKRSLETRQKLSKAKLGKKQNPIISKAHGIKMLGNMHSKLNRKVIDSDTNKIYHSINKAAKDLNINYSTLKKYLSGSLNNKTSLKYLNNG
jgi:group I intron endonuclease